MAIDITGLKAIGASLVLVSSALVIIAWTIKLFIDHYRQLEDLHPTLSLTKYRWLVWPAIVGNSLYSKLFGSCKDSFFKSFSWRSAFIIFLISIITNSLCLWLILGSAPNDAPIFLYEHLRFLLIDFFIFLAFNYFGDLISINFTRYLLYKIATRQSNFIGYILLDLGGILLGYMVTLIPVVSVGLYFMMTGNEIKPILEIGFLGTALHPFFLIAFALSIDSILLKIVITLSIFSIAVPTLLFLFLSVFTYFLFVIFSTNKDKKPYALTELAYGLIIKVAKTLGFIASILFAANILLPLVEEQAKVEKYTQRYKQNRQHKNTIEDQNSTRVVLSNISEYEKLLKDYNRALEIDPNNAEVYFNRGNILHKLGRIEEALESFDKTIELEPKVAVVYNNRGIVLVDFGRKEEALESYDQAIKLEPKDALTYHNRGIVLDDLGRKEEALESFDQAIKLNPKSSDVYNNRGIVLDDLGRKEEALESYDQAIKLNPKVELAHNNRGLLNLQANKLEKAMGDFEQAALKSTPFSRYNLAYTYFLLKKPYHSTYWYIESFLYDVDMSIALRETSMEYLISTLPILRIIFGRNEKIAE